MRKVNHSRAGSKATNTASTNKRYQHRDWRVVSEGTNHFFNPRDRVRDPSTNRFRTALEIHVEYAKFNGAEIFDHMNNPVDLDTVLSR
mgnify:FL=1